MLDTCMHKLKFLCDTDILFPKLSLCFLCLKCHSCLRLALSQHSKSHCILALKLPNMSCSMCDFNFFQLLSYPHRWAPWGQVQVFLSCEIDSASVKLFFIASWLDQQDYAMATEQKQWWYIKWHAGTAHSDACNISSLFRSGFLEDLCWFQNIDLFITAWRFLCYTVYMHTTKCISFWIIKNVFFLFRKS